MTLIKIGSIIKQNLENHLRNTGAGYADQPVQAGIHNSNMRIVFQKGVHTF